MEALSITIFVSLILAIYFVVMFCFSQRGTRRSIEQEALLPFDDGKPAAPAKAPKEG